MKKEIIVYDFFKFTVSQKVEFAQSIIKQMNLNPKFKNPDVSIEKLKAKSELLQVRNIGTLCKSKDAVIRLQQTENEWNEMMYKMARYVDRIADGDSSVIKSAGFSLNQQTSRSYRSEKRVSLAINMV